MATRNSIILSDFIEYCREHPDERFWQALRNWSGRSFIFAFVNGSNFCCSQFFHTIEDTFYWEGRNK